MVEIREETDEGAGGDQPQSSTSPPPRESGASGAGGSVMSHLQSKPVDSILWVLRIVTVAFTLLYAFPIMGVNTQQSFYSKALLAGAATNALRLHQRLGGFQLSREFFSQMLLEDACHYLFYCILFVGTHPVTMVLLPVFLFAFLHASSFTMQVLTVAQMQDSMVYRLLERVTREYMQSLLNVISCSEIFLMPMVVMMTFMGYCSLLLPFIYYRFLTFRYMSRRNPNTRQAFYQIRVALDQSIRQPRCPTAIRYAVEKCIAFVERLAPAANVA